jgi:hypothetical protein
MIKKPETEPINNQRSNSPENGKSSTDETDEEDTIANELVKASKVSLTHSLTHSLTRSHIYTKKNVFHDIVSV